MTPRNARARRSTRPSLIHSIQIVVLAGASWLLPAMALAGHTHVGPDGRETASCTCRPATEAERGDLSVSPDGWVQDEPRASFNRGFVPLPLVPDWVGSRVRATGGLAWGDADRDGDLDLAVGTYFANMWPPIVDYYNFIYLNNGGMLESAPTWISVDQRHTGDLEWGDLNGDGYPDLFVGNGGESFQQSQVFYGVNGLLPTSAGWNSAVSAWLVDAAIADFDLDNDLDVATANQGNSADPYRPTYLFINSGTGLVPTPYWQSTQVGITNSADWGDLNGDGRPDLAVAGWVNWQSGVFLNLGTTLNPNFAWTTGVPSRTDKGIGWSDVDGDGHDDLVVGGNGAPDWLFHNEGSMLGTTPVWTSGESYHGCQELKWVDIDADGDEDLCTVHFSTGHVRIYLNNAGVLSTIADWQYDAASSGTAIDFGDVDGDGFLDLAIGVANGPNEVFINTSVSTGVPETADDLPRQGLRFTAGPNPFRDRVSFRMESGSPLRWESLEVWDAAGRRLAEIRPTSADGFRRSHSVTWADANAPAGVYFARAAFVDEQGRGTSRTVRIANIGR